MYTILFVDLRSRDLSVTLCSATLVAGTNGALVLRLGAEVGRLADLVHPRCGFNPRTPIFLGGRYAALDSAGFAEVLGGCSHEAMTLVGGSGFGYTTREGEEKGEALRPFRRTVEGVLLPAGSEIWPVKTGQNSNIATAEATLQGLHLRARSGDRLPLIVEGQSDWVRAWEVRPPRLSVGRKAAVPTLPEEHRGDIFSPERLLRERLLQETKGDRRGALLLAALLRLQVDEVRPGCRSQNFWDQKFCDLVGGEERLCEAAAALMECLPEGMAWRTEFREEDSVPVLLVGDEEPYIGSPLLGRELVAAFRRTTS